MPESPELVSSPTDAADETRREAETSERLRAAYERATMGMTLTELRSMPRDELIQRYDDILRWTKFIGGPILGPDDYLNELIRRESEARNRVLYWLSWAVAVLTAVATVATIVAAIAAFG